MKIVKVEAFAIQAEPIDTRAYWGSRAWGTERAAGQAELSTEYPGPAAPSLRLFAHDRHRHRAHRNGHGTRRLGRVQGAGRAAGDGEDRRAAAH